MSRRNRTEALNKLLPRCRQGDTEAFVESHPGQSDVPTLLLAALLYRSLAHASPSSGSRRSEARTKSADREVEGRQIGGKPHVRGSYSDVEIGDVGGDLDIELWANPE